MKGAALLIVVMALSGCGDKGGTVHATPQGKQKVEAIPGVGPAIKENK